MTRVSVIFADRSIAVDGVGLVIDDSLWSFDEPHLHALQWSNSEGWVELVQDQDRPWRANERVTDAAKVQPFLDAHAQQRLLDESRLAAAVARTEAFVAKEAAKALAMRTEPASPLPGQMAPALEPDGVQTADGLL